MNITIETKDQHGNVQHHKMHRGYLSRFVNPDNYYPVNYTIKQDGTRVKEPTMLKGEDLTENQIAELFAKQLL
jgi:hypothetical protein